MLIEKKVVEYAENLLASAITKSDLTLLDKLLHDDLLCMIPNGDIITKAKDRAAHQAGTMVVERLDVTVEQINIVGDTAISTTVYDTEGVMVGSPIAGKFRYLRVWKMFDAQIKVISASCFQI